MAVTAREDTFPKLIALNAQVRPARIAFRHKDFGIWQSWNWLEVYQNVRAFAAGLQILGLKRGDKLAILGSNRPRLYWAMAAAQWLGAIPIPVYSDSVADEIAYVLAHAEVTHAVVQDQEQVDKLLSVIDQLPTLGHILYDKERGLRDYDHTRLHAIDSVIAEGRELDRQDDTARDARSRTGNRQGRGPRHHSLHVRHDGPSERRHAQSRQRGQSRRDRMPVRQAERPGRNPRLSADCVGRRPYLFIRPGNSRGLLRQLPGKPRDRGGGPARNRQHLRVRAAASLREPAHPHDGEDGGCRAPSSGKCSVIFSALPIASAKESSNRDRSVGILGSCALRSRRRRWSTRRCAIASALPRSRSATRRARPSGRSSFDSIARSAST